MATEPFLINPPRRLRSRRRRKNPVGETLTIIGANPSRRNPMRRFKRNAWFGHSAAHRRAVMVRWGKRKKSSVRKSSGRKRAYTVRRRSIDRRTAAYKKMRASQYREAAGFLALTAPGKKRRFRFKGGQWVRKNNPRRSYMRRRRVRRNTWFGEPRRHRRAAFKGWRRGHKIGGRRVKHYKKYRGNAPKGLRRRSRRSSYRRNPALSIGGVTRGLMDIRSWAPLAVTGGASAIVGGVVPGMLGLVNPWARLGAQLVTAIGGGALVSSFVDSRHGQAWMIVGVSMVGYQLLKQFVLVPYLPQFAVGLGQYDMDYNFDDVSQQVSAFPTEGVAAFPTEGVAGFGAYQEEVGSYPYDGM